MTDHSARLGKSVTFTVPLGCHWISKSGLRRRFFRLTLFEALAVRFVIGMGMMLVPSCYPLAYTKGPGSICVGSTRRGSIARACVTEQVCGIFSHGKKEEKEEGCKKDGFGRQGPEGRNGRTCNPD